MLEGTSTDRNVPTLFCIIYLKYDFLLNSSHFLNFIFSAPFTIQILEYCASRLLIINYLFYRLLFATQVLDFDYLFIIHPPSILKIFYLIIFEI